MSLITCLGSCIYQKDGYCSLDSISAWNGTPQGNSCIYFAEKINAEKDRTDGTQADTSGFTALSDQTITKDIASRIF